MTKRQQFGVRTGTSNFTALPRIDVTQWVPSFIRMKEVAAEPSLQADSASLQQATT